MSDKPNNTSARLAKVAFEEALTKITTAENRQAAVETNAALNDNAIERLLAAFEAAARTDGDSGQYWDARDLARLLEYSDYRNFLNTVDKAKDACKNTRVPVTDHFVDATDMIDIGKGASREVETIRLTRYACYLIAQNGDPKKQPVAFAQTYFAIQTRRQEIQDEEASQYVPLPEDEKRLLLRHEIKEHNKKLASAAKQAGVVLPLDFAIFQNAGHRVSMEDSIGLVSSIENVSVRNKTFSITWAAPSLPQICFAQLKLKKS